jgi:hypothetical protein
MPYVAVFSQYDVMGPDDFVQLYPRAQPTKEDPASPVSE